MGQMFSLLSSNHKSFNNPCKQRDTLCKTWRKKYKVRHLHKYFLKKLFSTNSKHYCVNIFFCGNYKRLFLRNLYAVVENGKAKGKTKGEAGGTPKDCHEIPAGICLFKFNNGYSREMCEIYWKLITETPQRHQWRRSSVFIVNFEHITHSVLVFPLFTLNK